MLGSKKRKLDSTPYSSVNNELFFNTIPNIFMKRKNQYDKKKLAISDIERQLKAQELEKMRIEVKLLKQQLPNLTQRNLLEHKILEIEKQLNMHK